MFVDPQPPLVLISWAWNSILDIRNHPKRYQSFGVAAVAFIYLAILAVKSYSGVFVSTDSADFLAASKAWMVPQTYGYPLYIVLGHVVNLLPGNLPSNHTVLLSALPAAITIWFTYLIVRHLTSKSCIALVASLVLLSTAVFLTEATITKGYALTGMFLTAAYYSYLRDWKCSVAVLLGLATAVHMTVAFIALLWLLADRRWKMWFGKPLLLYVCCGILPYALIPILMALDTPRFLAGSFTLSNLRSYWSGTSRSIIGMLSINDAPSRWWFVGRILVMSTGLGFIPLYTALRDIKKRYILVLIAAPMFMLWYVATCLDVQVWTYLSIGAPFVAVLVGIGLSKLEVYHTYVLTVSACILIGANSLFMNANLLTTRDPRAMSYKTALEALPDNSVVVVTPSAYSLGLFYTIIDGKKLIPLVYPYLEESAAYGTKGYDKFLLRHYDVTWSDTLEGVQQSLDINRPVYFVPGVGSPLEDVFNLVEPIELNTPTRVIGLTGVLPHNTFEVSYR